MAKRTAGMFFGETALTFKDSIRTATVIADKDCHIAIISKATYKNVLDSLAKAAYD